MILAADTARRIDPELAEVYWRLMTTKGHHHKQALCAVANRLVNRIFRVLRTGKPYGLRDLDGRPIEVAEAKTIIAERYAVPPDIRATRRVNRPRGCGIGARFRLRSRYAIISPPTARLAPAPPPTSCGPTCTPERIG